jgi:hypothetical protein
MYTESNRRGFPEVEDISFFKALIKDGINEKSVME